MRIIYNSCILIIILLVSCQTIEKQKQPDNVIEQKKMIAILTEIALLKSANDVNDKIFTKYVDQPFDYILKKYKIDSVTLVENIEYYNMQFNENLEIYRKVEGNINEKKSFIDSLRNKMDSLKKAKSKRKIDTLKTTLKTESEKSN